MCGIIGIVGSEPVAPRLIDALKRLEYRGYDSAGIATVVGDRIDRRRARGKLRNLIEVLERNPIDGRLGIGHTRWATHGEPNETNAHPHASRRVALVHNGIIENFAELRGELSARGHNFETDTDTETVVHLITDLLDRGHEPESAMRQAMARIEGAFALAVVFADADDLLVGARRGSPLVVGYGDGEMFLGSDALAVGPLTQRLSYLEEGDLVLLRRDRAKVIDAAGHTVQRRIQVTELSGALVGKGNYRHFMEKEIHEQPTVVGDTLGTFVSATERTVVLPDLPFNPATIDRATLIGCGSSYLAASVGRYWIEKFAKLPTEVDIASEFRYRDAVVGPDGMALFVSQSGETIDTLSALRYARAQRCPTVAVVNVPTSAMAREADGLLPTVAGPEIGVASTKAVMTQMTVLACLALALGRARRTLSHEDEVRLLQGLLELPARLAEVLNRLGDLSAIVETVAAARDVLYLGRGTCYPIAMEGALKLKEISYIHAEGYAAGEMKHGPIALIDEDVPVIVLAPSGPWFEKTASNVQEVAARRGRPIVITDQAGAKVLRPIAHHLIELPTVQPFVAPLLYTLPVQLLAYQVAVRKGTDVDQPRNLAKSVVVE